MKVHVTSQLGAQLLAVSQHAESVLVRKFIEWKSGLEDGHYWFSQNKLGDDGQLFHVHLIPNNEAQARQVWNRLWRGPPKRPWKRRSDRYLLYADGKRHGYLLIALLEDPGRMSCGYRRTESCFKILWSLPTISISMDRYPDW